MRFWTGNPDRHSLREMRTLALLALAPFGAPAAAEVKSATANSFALEYRAAVPVQPARLYQTVGEVSRWWSPAHTYSGKAENLSLELRPGGCFCESFPGGGIELLRVAHVDPGKRIVMTGGLGPLLYEAVTGVMDIRIAPAGTGSSLMVTYRAAGFANGNGDKLAPLVDQVMGEQVTRLTAAAR